MDVYRIKKRLAQPSCTVPKPVDLYWTQTVYFVIHLFNQGIVNVSEALTDPKMAFRKQSVTQLITYHTQKTKQTKNVFLCVRVGGGFTCVACKNKLKTDAQNKKRKREEG